MSILLKTLQRAQQSEATEDKLGDDDLSRENVSEQALSLADQKLVSSLEASEVYEQPDIEINQDLLGDISEEKLHEIETTDTYINKLSLEIESENSALASANINDINEPPADPLEPVESAVGSVDDISLAVSDLNDDVAYTEPQVEGVEPQGLKREVISTSDDPINLSPVSGNLVAGQMTDAESVESDASALPPSIADEFYQARKIRRIKYYSAIGAVVVSSVLAAGYAGWYWLNDGNATDSQWTISEVSPLDSANEPTLIDSENAAEYKTPNVYSKNQQGGSVDLSLPTATDVVTTAEVYSASPVPNRSSPELIIVTKRVFGHTEKRLLARAVAAFSAKDYFNANVFYRQVSLSNPSSIDALNGLAAVALAKGNAGAAKEGFYRVLAIDESNVFARMSLINMMQNISLKEKEIELSNLAKQFPEDPLLQTKLGEHYAAKNSWRKAQQAFFNAHQLDTTNSRYRYNLAASLDQLGKASLAIKYYEQLLMSKVLADIGISRSLIERRLTTIRTQP